MMRYFVLLLSLLLFHQAWAEPIYWLAQNLEDELQEQTVIQTLKKEEKNVAGLRLLNKITSEVSDQSVVIQNNIKFGKLRIQLFSCVVTDNDQMAFLQIWDSGKPAEIPGESQNNVTRNEQGEYRVFSGWMFASSPVLHALDHPIYDVWLLECK